MNEDVILEEHKRLVRANHCNNHKVLTDILTNVIYMEQKIILS